MSDLPIRRDQPRAGSTFIDTPAPGEAVVVIVYQPESGSGLFTTSIKLDKWNCTMLLTEEPGSDRTDGVLRSMAHQFHEVMWKFQKEIYERFGLGNKTFTPDRK